MSLPNNYQQYLGHGDREKSLAAIQCKKCNFIPEHFLSGVVIGGCNQFLLLSCTSSECPIGTWYVCCTCCQAFRRHAKAEIHVGSRNHLKNNASLDALTEMVDKTLAEMNDVDGPMLEPETACEAVGNQEAVSVAHHDAGASNDNISNMASSTSRDSGVLLESSVCPSSSSSNVLGHLDAVVADAHDEVPKEEDPMPKDNKRPLDARHLWLAEALKDQPKASSSEVLKALECSPNMQRFWLAEHEGYGAGVITLVTRAFTRSLFYGADQMPDFDEAAWQMQNFMQYVNMSETQQNWHAQITMAITSAGTENGIIKKTRVPNPQELRRFYKSDSKHSMWEALPIPQVQNIGGIAYVNPEHIVRFAFAAGLEFDDIMVTKDTGLGSLPGKQYHVADCQKIRETIKILQNAQDENGDYKIMLAWATEWRDGFSPNRTKNNRKSVVAWTFSLSPGKESVNDIGNTFCMALGSKKNKAWSRVEHQVRKDMSCFGDPNTPLEVYHGGLRKMVRVFVKRINASHDKPERADVTGTLGFSGRSHRCFGTLVDIVTPTCDSKTIRSYLEQAEPFQCNTISNSLPWGWSDDFLDGDDYGNTHANGRILPSCSRCRAIRLQGLMGTLPNATRAISDEQINADSCGVCADWTINSSKLCFKAPPDYPTTMAPNCPVEPPTGRCTSSMSLKSLVNPATGKEEKYLSPVALTFRDMVKACKFAFFHLVSTETPWTRAKGIAYLKENGIAPKLAEDLCNIAKDALKDGRAATVDYEDPEGIDLFRFTSSWIDPQLEVKDFIETLMHELFLGIGESNFELCSQWFKARNRDTGFRRNSQDLLGALKKFGLNWLHTHQFSSDESKGGGTFGTGAFQAENWLAWTRIQKVLYLLATVPLSSKNPQTAGNGDVLRLVISFTALAARALSHSGVDQEFVKEFSEYLKEFLSCVKDLDIQTRHVQMQKKTKKGTDVPQEAHGSDLIPALPRTIRNSSTATAAAGNQASKNPARGRQQAVKQRQTTKASSTTAQSSKRLRPAGCKRGTSTKKSRGDSSDSDYEDFSDDPSPQRKRSHKPNSKKPASKPRAGTPAAGRQGATANQTAGNHQEAAAKKKRKKPKVEWSGGGEAWWTKSNYLSLPNLVAMVTVYGLLVNFWDGGGKGEKFVQQVKPYITRGVCMCVCGCVRAAYT